MYSNILSQLADMIGIIGVSLTLIAYFLLSLGYWISDSLRYQSFNLIGSSLILFSLFYHWNLSCFIIEIAWILISLMGIYRVLRHHK